MMEPRKPQTRRHRPPSTLRTVAWTAAALLAVLAAVPAQAAVPAPITCPNVITADVVAIEQPIFYNRLGTFQPDGKIYALARDVVQVGSSYRLRSGKRPRPLVLRVNEGDCLEITFTNRLSDPRPAGIHVVGMQWFNGPQDDGSDVGQNGSSLVTPGNSTTYKLYAEREGGYLLYNNGTVVGGEADNGTIAYGLFGAVNVEPKGSEWYRSQVTRADMDLAVTGYNTGPDGKPYPMVNYAATYPAGHPLYPRPILNMRLGNEVVHSDLNAVITGSGGGNFGASYPYPETHVYPNRTEPFREFTVIFHDEPDLIQAFPHFQDEILQHTLHSVRDSFAINYGTGGIGAEILANRLAVGPMYDCTECKYEEFFLSSWVVGDPSMVVDIAANAPCRTDDIKLGVNCLPNPGPKATVAFFPDDPSNVFHSYLNDHVKFRNLHAGSDDHHIFHLHAHQWTHTPREDKSSYLDSQSIGQGTSFTYEIAYEGSGNRNRTAGDSIFHCHFYPHFAQGMWAMWRVHDVLELGTELDADGRPVHSTDAQGTVTTTARALPDAEIPAGTPIPGVVPIPSIAMAPVPEPVQIVGGNITFPAGLASNPGYPFWVPGQIGHRPPHPPMDFAVDSTGQAIDGGLARHVVTGGTAHSVETRLDFRKDLEKIQVNYIPENGAPEEVVAMGFHATPGGHPTLTPQGAAGTFQVNGAPPQPGAPYADPCVNDNGVPITDMRYYKAADIQVDTVLNKAGWHFPQQRMITLWNDVDATLNGTRAPEPFFFRANSGECIEFWHTNLVPNEYQLDDFQVRTPTDILGQHIHLVKFDVTSSDGSANGWNYEDGTFSPEEVQERICAIRQQNGCEPNTTQCLFQGPASSACPVPKLHPQFTRFVDQDCDGRNDWLGAQATIQRWWVDPVLTQSTNEDRTLQTVFTHDHYGPSTHQQAGLYAGLVVEPAGSLWFHNEIPGLQLGTANSPNLEQDGGPTSWQAVIQGRDASENYREFLLEFGDFQLAYEPNSPVCPDPDLGLADPKTAINPPGRQHVGPPYMYLKPVACPTNQNDPDGSFLGNFTPYAPCPEAISADDPGMVAVNYRNEPVPLRIRLPGSTTQASGDAGDLSLVYSSLVTRADPAMNVQPFYYPPLTNDIQPGDPYTPILRAYEGDRVKIKTLVGAHEEEHSFSAHDMKWLFEPDYDKSGWRNSQHMGISQWFHIEIPRMISLTDQVQQADFLYKPSAASEFQWDGAWGLLRLYRGLRGDLVALGDRNPDGMVADQDEFYGTLTRQTADAEQLNIVDPNAAFASQFKIACPANAPIRSYYVAAVAAFEALQNDPGPTGDLVYNSQVRSVQTYTHPYDPPEPAFRQGPLHDPTAIMFVYYNDLYFVGGRPRLSQAVNREPLILRANAGDCIRLKLINLLPDNYADMDGWNSMPMIIEQFNANQVKPSMQVGLHPQLVHYDVHRSDGFNVGLNPGYGRQTVAPNETVAYHWYAGDVSLNALGQVVFTPVEFGATGLISSDPIKHTNKGAVGALIIEPQGSTWTLDSVPPQSGGGPSEEFVLTRAMATVTPPSGPPFRELVAIYHDDVNLRYVDNAPVESLKVNEDPTESAQKGINYRTEPIWYRLGHAPDTPPEDLSSVNFSDATSSFVYGEPETPIMTAQRGTPVRFRYIHPGGHTQAHVPEIFGHLWQKEPYTAGSLTIGSNPSSEMTGTQHGHGPSNHFDAVLPGAGGKNSEPGDYLYRDYPPWLFHDGIWSIFRVFP